MVLWWNFHHRRSWKFVLLWRWNQRRRINYITPIINMNCKISCEWLAVHAQLLFTTVNGSSLVIYSNLYCSINSRFYSYDFFILNDFFLAFFSTFSSLDSINHIFNRIFPRLFWAELFSFRWICWIDQIRYQ